jgi:hypothetical protein
MKNKQWFKKNNTLGLDADILNEMLNIQKWDQQKYNDFKEKLFKSKNVTVLGIYLYQLSLCYQGIIGASKEVK